MNRELALEREQQPPVAEKPWAAGLGRTLIWEEARGHECGVQVVFLLFLWSIISQPQRGWQ